ncbi:MAG: zf-HC2 domain-containing protein [Candidatus Aminicenantes bacterium]|nr:zf-HC2 domain-containing protein [Candidatus Aminicenantes bacterium]
MNCRKAEKLLLRSLDGQLNAKEERELERHIEHCFACRQAREEYADVLDILRTTRLPELKPFFWQRLRPRLKEKKAINPLSVWKQWGILAIPLSLFLVVSFAAVLTLLGPRHQEKLSSSEAFLLQNTNPFQETSNLLDREKVEDKNMMLIFASSDEESASRRYLP